MIYIDSDNEYLYVLERAKNNSDTQYFLNKYDLDFICVGTIDITSIFRDYEITDNIIYRLNKQTGALEIQNYSMENEQFVIRCVLSYDNMLMIAKCSLSETDTKDKLFLVPFTDNSLSN